MNEAWMARMEAHMDAQTKALAELKGLPVMCAARGVQLETLNTLPKRVTDLETDMHGYRKLVAFIVTVSAGIATHKWWGGLAAGLQRMV